MELPKDLHQIFAVRTRNHYERIQKKTWYLADCMAFLTNFIGTRHHSDDILNLTPTENYTDKKYLEQLIKTEVLNIDDDSYSPSTTASDEHNPLQKKAKIMSTTTLRRWKRIIRTKLQR